MGGATGRAQRASPLKQFFFKFRMREKRSMVRLSRSLGSVAIAMICIISLALVIKIHSILSADQALSSGQSFMNRKQISRLYLKNERPSLGDAQLNPTWKSGTREKSSLDDGKSKAEVPMELSTSEEDGSTWTPEKQAKLEWRKNMLSIPLHEGEDVEHEDEDWSQEELEQLEASVKLAAPPVSSGYGNGKFTE